MALAAPAALAGGRDPERDILVTFENSGAHVPAGAPYRARKRYQVSAEALRHAAAVATDYALHQVDQWPIRALSVYCIVYRVAAGGDRDRVIEALRADDRVESAQPLNTFETGVTNGSGYDDTYAELQYGLDALGLAAAHRLSRGKGVRVAVIDSNVDMHHEDLRGRVHRVEDFAGDASRAGRFHGTAVTSVIAARANNARGIVGVAPEAKLDLYVACWSRADTETAVCDSFTLAQALDTLLRDPPDVLNLSLVGPEDGLVRRLLAEAYDRGVVLIAARPESSAAAARFPASMEHVIAVSSSRPGLPASGDSLLAPGEQILVAIPDNNYDFRSGSSLAAAHVSGVVALLLSVSPGTGSDGILAMLRQSQAGREDRPVSVNACIALRIAAPTLSCGS
jgi:subtilisin family serine protease